jgi:hypothetical protein
VLNAPQAMNVHIKKIAEDPWRYVGDGKYFRLNPSQSVGLDEWRLVHDIIAITSSYMGSGERLKPKQKIARLLRNPEIESMSSK